VYLNIAFFIFKYVCGLLLKINVLLNLQNQNLIGYNTVFRESLQCIVVTEILAKLLPKITLSCLQNGQVYNFSQYAD